MAIDEKTLRHVASVARLTLTDAEVKQFLPQLSEVLDQFSAISEVDTDGFEPALQPIPLADVFREDRIEESLSTDEALANTTHKDNDYFKGPRAV